MKFPPSVYFLYHFSLTAYLFLSKNPNHLFSSDYFCNQLSFNLLIFDFKPDVSCRVHVVFVFSGHRRVNVIKPHPSPDDERYTLGALLLF